MTDTPTGTTTSKTYTYAYDVHGSVSMLLEGTSGESTVKSTYGFDAYGKEDKALTSDAEEVSGTSGNADPLNSFRYTAKRWDSGSDTLDMGARRFGPDTTRFLQPDLFKGALANLGLSADPLTGNRYALAGGNPVSFIETDGHMVVADGGGGSTTPNFQVMDNLSSSSGGSGGSSGGGDSGSVLDDVKETAAGFLSGVGEIGASVVRSGVECLAAGIGGCAANQAKETYDTYKQDGFGVAVNRFNPVYHFLWAGDGWLNAARSGNLRGAGRQGAHGVAALASTLGIAAAGASIVAPTSATALDAGLSTRGIQPALGTRIRPEGIPVSWRIRGTQTPGGIRYYDPSNPGNSVRVMQGTPNSPYPTSRSPYVRWQQDGHPLDAFGNKLPTAHHPDAHIPLQDFRFFPELFE